jgi:hypothetical protein
MLSKKPKEEYWRRRRKVRTALTEWGISKEVVKDIDREHPVGVLEKIIEATRKRSPENPAKYFLNGLNYSRIKHDRSPLSASLRNKE